MQFVVDGKPFLMLGGELGNSSASSLEYMAPIWPRLDRLGLNTVLAPVYWELLEPVEGRFDFARVDGLIREARAHDMRLVLLWFGSWKNSMSSYVPTWVKRDADRFPRAESVDGTPLEILSPFHEANVAADARAFAALMGHLRDADRAGTVILVQVENEIGMIPDARDHSDAADAAYRADVPEALLTHLAVHRQTLHPRLGARWTGATSGTWAEVFGDGDWTEELFMAWHFARYVERIAEAGKAAHPLPMYVNAALVRPGYRPGAYPSAGPLPHLLDVWRAGAPSLDFFAPDVYFPNYVEWLRQYDVPGNAVFIPEAHHAGAAEAVANAFYAIGAHDAIGFSPFSIEDAAADDLLGDAYATLRSLAPLIHAHQGRGTMVGVRPPVAFDGTVDVTPQEIVLGGYRLTVTFTDPWTPLEAQRREAHGGLLIALDDETFVVAGTGITVTVATPEGDRRRAGFDRVEEGAFVDGRWQPGRLLNGDQTHQGRHVRLPPGQVGVQRVTLYTYP